MPIATASVQISGRRPLPETAAKAILYDEGAKAARKAGVITRTSWAFIAPKGRPRAPGERDPRRKRYSKSIKASEPYVSARGTIVVDVYSDDPKAGWLEHGVRRRTMRIGKTGKRGGGFFLPGTGKPIVRQTVTIGRPAGRYGERAKRMTSVAVRVVFREHAAIAAAKLRRMR